MSPKKKNQKKEDSEYRYLQLIDGTEIVSIVHEGDDPTIVRMEDPLRIVNMTPFLENSSDGSHTIMLTPWIAFTEDLYISVDRDKILVITNASQRLIRHYKKVIKMVVERSMKEELDMLDRSSLPDFEKEMESTSVDPESIDLQESDNPLQDLVDSLKKAIDTKKKNIVYH